MTQFRVLLRDRDIEEEIVKADSYAIDKENNLCFYEDHLFTPIRIFHHSYWLDIKLQMERKKKS